MLQPDTFATKALQRIMYEPSSSSFQKKRASPMISINNTMQRSTGRGATTTLKRSRPGSSSCSSFDMRDFIKASQQIEETIAFPSIEWPSFDDDDSSSSSSSNNQATATSSSKQASSNNNSYSYGKGRKRL
mmetsp:Transcript_37076/g.41417  ORF Transcript_37076/g.41417 Transcript_37076/m.41417 type:complete len:131 (-) Transcript_37076:29-421(-)